jgi:FkbM family methyltransferase
LDIDALVGDTALYYARRGAFVAAVEPLPSNYEVMLRNLELNPGLKLKIVPVNAAVSGVDGFVEFRYNVAVDDGASAHGIGRFIAKVKSMRLSTLIRRLENRGIDMSRFKVRVLKVDCKGYEFELMGDDSLGLFDIVKVECSGYLINKMYHELMSSALKYGLDKHGIMT